MISSFHTSEKEDLRVKDLKITSSLKKEIKRKKEKGKKKVQIISA